MRLNLSVICLWVFTVWSIAANGQKTNLDLEKYALHVVNDSLVEDRLVYNDSLKTALIERLQSSKSRKDPFKELTAVSVQNSGDEVFRIFSWQVYISPDQYQHEGIIQFLDGSRNPIVLNDKSDEIRFPDRKQLTSQKWFGALYYNIIPFKAKGKVKYLLFGFDGATRSENCKIVDILNIDKKGKLSFGAPMFDTEIRGNKKTAYRHFHQYDQNAKAILRYDVDQEMIIFDHLIPWTSKEYGVGMTFVPDGSYEGFKFKRGTWREFKTIALSHYYLANYYLSTSNYSGEPTWQKN